MNKLGRLRVSAAVGYLAPARIRPNLEVLPDSHVARLCIEKGRCAGVEVLDGEGGLTVLRARLVVVSAGAIMTPGLLLRSGIGAPERLSAIGVAQVADLPGVGRNLSDHPALSVVCEVKQGVVIDFDAPIIQSILRYTAEGSDKRNDLQIEQISFAGRPGGPPRFVIAPVLEYVYGRGEVTLDTADPLAAPKIANHFCEDPRDAERLARCVLDTLAFTRRGDLADMISAVTFPDPAKGGGFDDMLALCRKYAGSGYHPSGTAKMGPREDPLAVVDSRGRCHGVEQLVVADASIMPFVPRANTNLTCIMIGEKIGEWIRTERSEYGL
jgi:choline dehydrogenase